MNFKNNKTGELWTLIGWEDWCGENISVARLRPLGFKTDRHDQLILRKTFLRNYEEA